MVRCTRGKGGRRRFGVGQAEVWQSRGCRPAVARRRRLTGQCGGALCGNRGSMAARPRQGRSGGRWWPREDGGGADGRRGPNGASPERQRRRPVVERRGGPSGRAVQWSTATGLHLGAEGAKGAAHGRLAGGSSAGGVDRPKEGGGDEP